MTIPAHIFRAYDIRGRVADELTPATTTRIGQAFADCLLERGESEILIAGDVRLSTAELRAALATGLSARGLKVFDIGTVPTPILYYATETSGISSGIMITGSHNPPDMNGLKLVVDKTSFCGNEILQLYDRAMSVNPLSINDSVADVRDFSQKYDDAVYANIDLVDKLRVGMDCGNGVTSDFAPKLFERMGCEVFALYAEPDGNFPNHHPDPIRPQNLVDLIALVESQNLDLGIAFDGDGDRLGVVVPRHGIVHTDQLLALFSAEILQSSPGASVVFDVKCGNTLRDLVTQSGGVPILSKTGHTNIKRMVRAKNSPLGGEFAGHVCFADRWYGFDDAMYAAARLVELVSASPRSLADMVSKLPKYHSSPEVLLPVADDETKFEIMDTLSRQKVFNAAHVTTIDGLRVDYPDGWGLVRASNTGPNLTLRFEGKTEEALHRLTVIFEQALANIDVDLKSAL